MKDTIAKRWSADSMMTIVTKPKNEDHLDIMWNSFNSMPIEQQEDSDEKSLEIYGVDNNTRYEEFKSKFIKKDIDYNKETLYQQEGMGEYGSDINVGIHSYKYPKIAEAIAWIRGSMYDMIYYTCNEEQLEKMWNSFNSMPIEHQRISDAKSIELFGMDNFTHYNAIKSILLKKDIPETDMTAIEDNTTDFESSCYDSVREQNSYTKAIKTISLIENSSPCNLYEEILLKNTIERNIKDLRLDQRMSSVNALWSLPDMPILTIAEINENYVVDNSDTDYADFRQDWIQNYSKFCLGVLEPKMSELSKEWIGRVRALTNSDNEDSHNKLIGLGWIPNMSFTPNNRAIASKRASENINSRVIETLDMTNFIDTISETSEYIVTEMIDTSLVPIFIVLVSGTALLSKVIKDVTKSNYSHSAISLDSKLDKLYSYNLKNPDGVDGLSVESLDWYNDKVDIKVYSIFVNKTDKKKIQDNINYFVSNKENTKYSMASVLAMPFSKINLNCDFKLICSEFVDKILKFANIDITNKISSHVTPADFEKSATVNGKIYKLYEGNCKVYNPKKINYFIKSMIDKISGIKESNSECNLKLLRENSNNLEFVKLVSTEFQEQSKDIYENYIQKHITAVAIREVKEFPVQFTDDGDMLLKNIKSIDFEKEYSDCHRLLMIYKQDKNYEGMKYEVSKLWFLNSLLEEKIYKKKNLSDSDRTAYNKVRARILNDFNTYVKFIIKENKSFNFKTYYNNTPFCDETVKITGSTLKYTVAGIKKIILGL